MKKKVILSIYLLFIIVGMNFQFMDLGLLNLSNSKYLELIFVISLLGIYIVPGIFLLKKLDIQLNKINYLVPIAIFSGFFMPGVPSGVGNFILATGLKKIFGSTALLSNWSAALTAPFVEEFFKLCCVLIILYLLKVTDPKIAFIVGISVGFGFQIMEDISYVVQDINSSHSIYEQLFSRISGAFISHWAYTGVLSIGVITAFKRSQLFSKKEIWCFVVGPIILHFLWNSPLNEIDFYGIQLLAPLLSVITLLLVIKIIIKIQSPLTTS